MANIEFAIRTFTTDTTGKIVVISGVSTVPTVAGVSVDSPTKVDVGIDGAGTVLDSSGNPGVEPALYSWKFSTTGLTANTDYSFTVTQGSNSRSGTLRTQLSSSGEEDFSIFVVSCDHYSSGTDKGCYGYMHEFSLANNVKAIIHQDDHGYVDNLVYGNSSNPASPIWNTQAPESTPKAYGYACGYAAYLGLIDATGVTNNPTWATRFHDEDRIWCHTNIPMVVQVGDHEALNNPEEGTAFTTAHYDKSKEAWLGTIGAGMPYLDTNFARGDVAGGGHLAFTANLGPIEAISFDRVYGLTTGTLTYDDTSNATEGQYASRATAKATPVDTRWLGTTQVSDLTGAVDATSPFKMLVMTCGSRQMMTRARRIALIDGGTWTNSAWLGAQQPLHDYTSVDATDSEWLELMSNSGGVCQKAQSYGGVVFGVHGDTHHTGMQYLYYPQDASNAAISMYQFSCGSVCAETSQSLHPDIVEGYNYQGNHQQYLPDWIDRTGTPSAGRNTCLRIDATKASGDWVLTVNTLEVDDATNAATVTDSRTLTHGTADNAPSHLRKGWA